MSFEFNGHIIKAITIKQPYASLIVNGIKDIENRTWTKKLHMNVCKNWLFVHSSTKKVKIGLTEEEKKLDYPLSSIVGMMHINCIGKIQDSVHVTKWAEGPKCWYIDAVIKFNTPIHTVGKLGQWNPDSSLNDKLTEQINKSMYNIISLDNIEFIRDTNSKYEIYYATQRGKYMSWDTVIQSLINNTNTFVYKLIQTLLLIEHKSYFWECDKVVMGKPFRFAIYNSKTLAKRKQDNNAFGGIINCSKNQQTKVFPSLNNDTNLVVPCNLSKKSNYTSLATFTRTAPVKQQVDLWQKVGENIKEGDWVSTSGLGVAWLHVRIATRPKYYHNAFNKSPIKSSRELIENCIENFKFPLNFVNAIVIGNDWKGLQQSDLITYYLELLPKNTRIIGTGKDIKNKIDEIGFVSSEIYPTNWKKYGRFGKHKRNERILKHDIDLITIFGNKEQDLIQQANKKGIKVLELNI